jgi:hypothetical protein
MTNGEIIKNKFKLDKYKHVLISRALIGTKPIYFVYFDSRRPNIPITRQSIKSPPFVSMLYQFNPNTSTPIFLPAFPIEEYGGNYKNAYFFVINLAGKNLIKENLLEGSGFTIDDLRKNAISPITKKYSKLRDTEGEQGSILEELMWNELEDTMLMQFFTLPTYTKTVDTITKKGSEKSDNHYRVFVQFDEVAKWLGKKSEFVDLKSNERIRLLRNMIRKGEVRLHANDFSFYFQGMWENAAILGYNIFDFPGPKGKGIWSNRHEGESPAIYISKHLFEVLGTIPFIIDEINKKIK